MSAHAPPTPADASRLHAFVALLLRLASRFINLAPARIVPEIDRALADTAAFVDADRGYLFAYDLAAGTTSNTHEWCAPGVSAQREALQDIPVAMFPDWLAAHQRGDPLLVPDVLALDADDPMRQVLEPQGILTTVALPLRDEAGLWGFVGFDFVRQHRRITAEEMGLLQLFAQMLVNVNARARTEASLHALNATLEARVAERTRELAAATARAEAASQAKSALMARVSHELRTPLNAVLGFSQLLSLDEGLRANAGMLQQVEQVRGAGAHLLQMVDEMLDIASAESGRMALRPEAVALPALVTETLALVEPLARARAVALHGPAGEDPPAVAWADRMRLRQILFNLLSNAVKYNREGGHAEVQLRAEGTRVQLRVQDSGLGLTPAQLASVFDPFDRAGAESGPVQGTGLGLAIARQLAQAMGGTLTAHSVPGQGSCFVLELPTPATPGDAAGPADPPAAPPPPVAPQVRPTMRVLYVEDNPVNLLLMEATVARPECAGIELHTAADGPSGLAAAGRLRPHLVLLDISLPGLSGLQVLQRLRASPETAALPCVAVSANALPEDIRQAREAGFADYLTKPFAFEQLVALLERHRPAAQNIA